MQHKVTVAELLVSWTYSIYRPNRYLWSTVIRKQSQIFNILQVNSEGLYQVLGHHWPSSFLISSFMGYNKISKWVWWFRTFTLMKNSWWSNSTSNRNFLALIAFLKLPMALTWKHPVFNPHCPSQPTILRHCSCPIFLWGQREHPNAHPTWDRHLLVLS